MADEIDQQGGTQTLAAIIILLLVVILLAVTNPSAKTHRSTIQAEFSQQRPVAGAVGLGVVDAQLAEYHSLVLASYTTTGDQTRSVGALGMVWVLAE